MSRELSRRRSRRGWIVLVRGLWFVKMMMRMVVGVHRVRKGRRSSKRSNRERHSVQLRGIDVRAPEESAATACSECGKYAAVDARPSFIGCVTGKSHVQGPFA